METAAATQELLDLIARSSGDEKHDASSFSTLDVIHVLYEVLRVRSARTRSGRSATASCSRRATARSLTTPCSRSNGFFPPEELERFMTWDGILGAHPDRLQVPGVEVSTGSLGHGLPMAVGVAYALRAREPREQRVFVLTGDAELNEGSNWEAILHAGSAKLANLTLIVVDNRSSSVSMGDIAERAARVRLGRGHRRRSRPRTAARGLRASQRTFRPRSWQRV